jgi:hypothetical protein
MPIADPARRGFRQMSFLWPPLYLALAAVVGGWDSSVVGSQTAPSELPLIRATDLHYLGAFDLPMTDGTGTDEARLTWGGSAMSVTPERTLLLVGHDWYQKVCEVSIPEIGEQASIVQPCADVLEGRRGQVDEGNVKVGGTLVWDGRIIISAYSFYDADGTQTLSHFASGRQFATAGDLIGPVQVGDDGAGFVSGYMSPIPEEWRKALGGPALTGQCCLNIITRTSSGPAVAVFDPRDVGRTSPVPAKLVLGYPPSDPLAPADSQNALYTRASWARGIAFPAGTRSLLFIGRHGTGRPCYGSGSSCSDPVHDWQGEHAYPYHHQVWAYDANDLVAVKNGSKDPWEIRPYATWRLEEMNDSGSANIASAAYDPLTRRLFVTETYGDEPKVHVYQVASSVGRSTPSPN